MTKSELLELIANRENSGVEFKRDTIDNRELAKELVALANLRGGHLLLGVERDGTIAGLTRSAEGLEEWVMQACRDKVRPELNPYFEIIRDATPGRSIAAIGVDRGWTVHHVWHDHHRTYYVRVGTTNREASQEELARLFQQRRAIRLEMQPVFGTTVEHLDRRRLTDYFTRVREQQVPVERPSKDWHKQAEESAKAEDLQNWRDSREGEEYTEDKSHLQAIMETMEAAWRKEREAEWETLLTNTEFLSEETSRPATVAGVVLFGHNPSRFLPQSKIDAAAYFGCEKEYDARERLTLRGPVTPLVGSDGTLLEPGLVEQAIAFVERNIGTVQLVDGARRVDRWDYPKDVLRETIVNAIVHRDYLLSGTDIELSIFSDRLEVISPGHLPNGVTPERMRAGCRSARNELVKDVMRDYGYLEHMGMGVPRKIVRGMREHNGTEPALIEEGEQFIVRLWKDQHATNEHS